MENLFSELIIGLDELNDHTVEDAKVKDLQNNIDKKEKEDILNQREVEDNIKDINQNYSKDIKRRHHYTIEDKLDAIEFFKKGNSIHKTTEKYTVDRKTIKYWIAHEKEYLQITNPSIKEILHPGRKPQLLTKEEEENICRWIDEQNDNGVPINLTDALNCILSLENNSLKGRSKLTNIKLISRFLKIRGYTKRTVGHRGQEISLNALERLL